MWHIYTMKYYAAIKRKFMSFAGTYMNLQNRAMIPKLYVPYENHLICVKHPT